MKIKCQKHSAIWPWAVALVVFFVLMNATTIFFAPYSGNNGMPGMFAPIGPVILATIITVIYSASVPPINTADEDAGLRRGVILESVLCYCFLFVLALYSFWVMGAIGEAVTHLQVLTKNIGVLIALSTAVCVFSGLLLNNVAMRNAATRYGIPLKITYGGATEPIVLIAELLSMVLVGLIAPLLMLRTSTVTIPTLTLTGLFIAVGVGCASKVLPKKSNKRNWEVYAKVVFIILVVIVTASFSRATPEPVGRYSYLELIWGFVPIVVVAAYIMSILAATIMLILNRLSGNGGKYVAITEIEGDDGVKKPYVVAMRHSSDKWICLPYTVAEDSITCTNDGMENFVIASVQTTKTLATCALCKKQKGCLPDCAKFTETQNSAT